MYICNSLIKYDYCNFSLTILEYCSPDKCLERENYYLKLFKPEYNIAQDPTAPFSGRKHSDKSKTIMSDAKKGENNPNFGKTLPDETKQIMSDAAKQIENPGRFKPGQQRSVGAEKPSQAIEVTDIKNNTTTCYDSIGEAARALNLPSHKVIANYIKNNQQKPYKGKYTFASPKR